MKGKMAAAVFAALFLAAWTPAGAIMAAQNSREHGTRDPNAHEVTPRSVANAEKNGRKILLIDVRDPEAYAAGHAEGAINIPLPQLKNRIKELAVPKSTEIVTMCAAGNRSSRAAVVLNSMGYKTASFCTLKKWQEEGLKTVSGKKPS